MLRLLFAAALVVMGGTAAAADPFEQILINAEGQKLQPLVGARCTDLGPLKPSECAVSIESAYAAGCINVYGKRWLQQKSYGILCAGARVMFVCPCGCFDRGTAILASDGWRSVESLVAGDALVTLADGAWGQTEGWLALAPRRIDYTTKGPEQPPLFVFALANGRELAVSEFHALVTADGTMRFAHEVKVGDSLADLHGGAVRVETVTRRAARDGHVYNVLMQGESREAHIIVAEGVFVGDTMWQGTWQSQVEAVKARQ